MEKNSKIYIAGHTGLVGSSILRCLRDAGYSNVVSETRRFLDLTDKRKTYGFFDREKPEYVFLAAARVGGIKENSDFPAEFIDINLKIQTNVINSCREFGAKKLLFLGSSCIYPKFSEQPIQESSLLAGHLEPTNEAYAIAKIAGLMTCKAYNRQYGTNFIAAMPTNLYGPNDNFDSDSSHVIPGIMSKYHRAKVKNLEFVTLWGTGGARREFLYVDDLAEALVFMMKTFDASDEKFFLNVGTGQDIPIKNLANKIRKIVGYEGKTIWDTKMPDGTPRKLLDVSRINALGWKAKIPLEEGIKLTYEWFVENYGK